MRLLQKIFQDTYIIFAIIYVLIILGVFQFTELPLWMEIVGIISTFLVDGKILYQDLKGE